MHTISISLGPTQAVGQLSFFWQQPHSTRWVVRYAYVIDLNNDGLEEVIFAGFETQPNSPAMYSDTRLFVFGWEGSRLVDATSRWLPNNAHQVQGVGDVQFGDFNGDGRVDVFLSAYTDMTHPNYVSAYALINQGTALVRQDLGKEEWQHGAAVFDINKDGYDDVLTVGWSDPGVYLGSPQGLEKYEGRGPQFGAGIAIADFMGDGTASVIITDWAGSASVGSPESDTALFTLEWDSSDAAPLLEYRTTLPKPILDIYTNRGNPNFGAGLSHDVRAVPYDFSGDGLMDVIVVGVSNWNEDLWQKEGVFQFLQNDGNGSFRDVTSDQLAHYERRGSVSYSPVLKDLNSDGHMDIFGLEGIWGAPSSTRFLMGTHDGKFAETSRSYFEQKIVSTAVGTVARGPSEQYYLVWDAGQNGMTDVRYAALQFDSRYTLSGKAYHWKSGALMGGVAVESTTTSSHSTGSYALDSLTSGKKNLRVSKIVGTEETGAVSSADALAALKIAVGRNPNSDGAPVSPYQFISADVNGDGKVTSADALAILKMAVKRSDAPAREWIFVDEKHDFWNEATNRFTTTNALLPKPNDLAITVDPAARSEVNLVVLLKGDVNGSWLPVEGNTILPAAYFEALALANSSSINIAQFG